MRSNDDDDANGSGGNTNNNTARYDRRNNVNRNNKQVNSKKVSPFIFQMLVVVFLIVPCAFLPKCLQKLSASVFVPDVLF